MSCGVSRIKSRQLTCMIPAQDKANIFPTMDTYERLMIREGTWTTVLKMADVMEAIPTQDSTLKGLGAASLVSAVWGNFQP